MLSIAEKIWADTNLSIGGSPIGYNPMVSSINSLYLASPTRSSKVLDWMSDPTDNFGIIILHSIQKSKDTLKKQGPLLTLYTYK